MGIDLKHRHLKRHIRHETRSQDPYLRLLIKLYRYLARRTRSKFAKVILHRMYMSRVNRPVMSVSRVSKFIPTVKKGKAIACVVGKVLNDERLLDLPKMCVCALEFSEQARARILKAGGCCMTFDQLALTRPTGSNTFLLRGSPKARHCTRSWGKPAGTPGSHARPRVEKGAKTGRKFERARGRRKSCGFRV
ncbi:60S ribosomal protein L18 [Pelomyxa schiedti]|nr:60S ribosomal protein L18 [Pelomyxa schiedti]